MDVNQLNRNNPGGVFGVFQSPYGVMDVNHFEDGAKQSGLVSDVSVPLRGNGCESRKRFRVAKRTIKMFQSPYGVMDVNHAAFHPTPNDTPDTGFSPLTG